MRTAWVLVVLLLATGARAERVAPKPPPKKPSCAEIEKREAAVKQREDAVAKREAQMAKNDQEMKDELERRKQQQAKLLKELK